MQGFFALYPASGRAGGCLRNIPKVEQGTVLLRRPELLVLLELSHNIPKLWRDFTYLCAPKFRNILFLNH